MLWVASCFVSGSADLLSTSLDWLHTNPVSSGFPPCEVTATQCNFSLLMLLVLRPIPVLVLVLALALVLVLV